MPATATAHAVMAASNRSEGRRRDVRRSPTLESPAAASSVLAVATDVRGLLHLHQELEVGLGLLHLLEQQLQRLLHLERMQHPAQLPDDLELLGRHEDLFLASARCIDIDRREDALVRELAVELELHVSG